MSDKIFAGLVVTGLLLIGCYMGDVAVRWLCSMWGIQVDAIYLWSMRAGVLLGITAQLVRYVGKMQ